MAEIELTGTVRFWDEGKQAGLAVVDVPDEQVEKLGGRRQMRVTGTLQDAPYAGSTMLVPGGGLCVGVSQAAMKAAGVEVGDEVTLRIAAA
jgi:hypothetical protein